MTTIAQLPAAITVTPAADQLPLQQGGGSGLTASVTPLALLQGAMAAWILSLPTTPPVSADWWNNSGIPTLGAFAVIPNSIATIAALRAATTATVGPAQSYVLGYHANADGGEGVFVYVSTDTTSADNGGTIIVDASGRRWYRLTGGAPTAVEWFGAVGNGTTDDTAAFQAALNSIGIHGGTVHYTGSHKINSITIPVGVILRGPNGLPGAPGLGNFSPAYNSLFALLLTSGSTITLSGGATIDGAYIFPFGMTFQQTNASAWVGTAITGAGDDMTVRSCMIMGFSQGFYSTGFSRVRISDSNFDCVNCVHVDNSNDVCHFENLQAWPFGTISQAGTNTLTRTGVAYSITNSNDDSKFIGCFSYGYAVGFSCSGSIGVLFLGCSADNTAAGTGIGFSVVGSSTDTKLTACVASAQQTGFNITTITVSGLLTTLTDCDAHGNTGENILIDTAALGDVLILGGIQHSSPTGILISSANALVDISHVSFQNISGQTISASVATTNVRIGPMLNYYGLAAGAVTVSGNVGTQSATAASSILNLPMSAEVINVLGTANFGSLNGGWAGRRVTLVFAGALSVFSSTGAVNAMRLASAATFTTATGSTLSLVHTGSQWFETGRAA
jgi:hypothetical protein